MEMNQEETGEKVGNENTGKVRERGRHGDGTRNVKRCIAWDRAVVSGPAIA